MRSISRPLVSPAAARFVGAWKLISYELRLGRILYQANGQMSAQLMHPESASFGSSDPLQATPDEAATVWRNYIGYWGTYTVDEKASVVTIRSRAVGSQTGSVRNRSARSVFRASAA